MEEKLWEKELWTQQEVAEYFRVVPGTVKNWRDYRSAMNTHILPAFKDISIKDIH